MHEQQKHYCISSYLWNMEAKIISKNIENFLKKTMQDFLRVGAAFILLFILYQLFVGEIDRREEVKDQ